VLLQGREGGYDVTLPAIIIYKLVLPCPTRFNVQRKLTEGHKSSFSNKTMEMGAWSVYSVHVNVSPRMSRKHILKSY
jgi:hypothetical protein